ncbi:MAG: peptidoglycan editing factor PgeF [Thermodesulfobacteriota bacterium]
MIRLTQKGAMPCLEADAMAALDWLTHAFFTRLGGVSQGPFSSLNTGFFVGDRQQDVHRNLAMIARTFSIPASRLVQMRQVHGDRIVPLDGDAPAPGAVPPCDGLVTDRPEMAIGIKTADCVPLFFADRLRRVIGVAHAGWRGTALGIASKMVTFLQERFSCRTQDILVAIGPAIGACCYQVDGPVHDAFRARAGVKGFLHPCRQSGRWMLDLASANRMALTDSGVPAENICEAGYCTACRQDLFFSHRATRGDTGRQINLLMLRDGSC